MTIASAMVPYFTFTGTFVNYFKLFAPTGIGGEKVWPSMVLRFFVEDAGMEKFVAKGC